ncbi:LysR family transcriptional regulator [Aureimonas sp. AU40]|uniref:LysR family transcriptional regulator n=1 Tax=Aureimonas sp. AU40 TaxID=1637747 RepID=UPI0009EABB18|nr:LysR family transcriptional regulator [Aureimonas sp. AU40]
MARWPSLSQLRTFLAVVETGTLSLAAKRLHLAQPAVSQQLQELERLLDVRVLDRAAGRAQPTPAGETLLEPARRALAAMEDAVEAVSRFGSEEAGRLRIGTGATACTFLLPPVLSNLKSDMPGLDITVAIGNTVDILPRVEAGEIDVGLVTLPAPSSRALETTLLMREPLLALFPAGAAVPDHVTPSAMAAEPLILYESGGHTRGGLDRWFGEAGLAPSPIMELGSVETIKRMVAVGLGASILPGLALAEPIPGTICRPLDPPLCRELGLTLRASKIRDRGLRLFLRRLEEIAAAEPLARVIG